MIDETLGKGIWLTSRTWRIELKIHVKSLDSWLQDLSLTVPDINARFNLSIMDSFSKILEFL